MQAFRATFRDPEEMLERMAPVARDFSIEPSRATPFACEVDAARLGDLGLFNIAVRESRVVSHGPLGYFSLNIPGRSGLGGLRNGHIERFECDAAYLASPADPLDLRMPDADRVFVLNIFKRSLDTYRAAMNGGVARPYPALDARLRLDTPAGQALRRLLSFLWSEIQSRSLLVDTPLIATELEQAVLTAVLLAADADESSAMPAGPPALGQLARSYIMEHLAEPLSIGHIAGATGIHARALQRAFHTAHGTSVMAFVRARRLERVREELLAGDPAVTKVTDVALGNGFAHLGRFASMYRRRFGESPSQTLQRTRHGPRP